ncbi:MULTISPECIES: dihydroxyacetone kinase subunit DhaL [unclassified Rhizobium]|uniref:dihydroxyacetone kinase subunit DhaL n=1 Tax=unclassified Rhizobium TaxID=2613769 RepID=UPI001783AC1C|nr:MULTISPECIES: dihydroxyacetone kinase subunit DhaL [unclassified Rhizobium]MBD8689817.1 dihydroxyacetone kinase subunit L [Rhizobium sp. CFBP 13644]MBD8694406.1 dihydroxyacetone kinase subunit L [Rhizobium sp. CFBP 13717]
MSVTTARFFGCMLSDISTAINAEKDYLTALDGAIGDGDHGITMSLGFNAVTTELASMDLDRTAACDVFTTAATAFLNAVGASTGPLYASAFLKAAQVLKNDDTLSIASQVAIIEAMTTGIQERGKGHRGDKTMLDAWIPATEAAIEAHSCGAAIPEMWGRLTQAARVGANATRSMVATRGRASRLGERSLGHMDPGAASAVIVLHAMMRSFVSVNDMTVYDRKSEPNKQRD